MTAYDLSQLRWTAVSVTIPDKDKAYRLAHLRLSKTEAPQSGEVAEYSLALMRTDEIICTIRVSPHELDDFHSFQNGLLRSKLD